MKLWIIVVMLGVGTCCFCSAASGENAFDFVVMADPHGYFYDDIIDQVNLIDPQPAFVLVNGDVIGRPSPREAVLQQWAYVDVAFARFNAPVITTPADRDVAHPDGYKVYKERYGHTYTSFDHGNSHFIVLCCFEPERKVDVGLDSKQIEWLKKDLEANKNADHIFVFIPNPIWDRDDWQHHDLLAQYAVRAVFTGDNHKYSLARELDGVQYFFVGSCSLPMGGYFRNFVLMSVDEENVHTEVVKYTGERFPHTMASGKASAIPLQMHNATTFKKIEISEGTHQTDILCWLKNPLTFQAGLEYKWETAGTTWKVFPSNGSVPLSPKGKLKLAGGGIFDPDVPVPIPSLAGTVTLEDGTKVPFEVPYQPIIRRHAVANKLARAPVLDGTTTVKEYAGAKTHGGFLDYHGRSVPHFDTAFKVTYDNQNLYLAITAEEPEPEGILTRAEERDGDVFSDDAIEIFIDVNLDRKTYRQFALNLGGATYDADGYYPEWDAEWQAKTTIDEKNYSMEIVIPFASLEVEMPKPGDTWGLNVYRTRHVTGKKKTPFEEVTAWNMTYDTFHTPTHFGNLTFE